MDKHLEAHLDSLRRGDYKIIRELLFIHLRHLIITRRLETGHNAAMFQAIAGRDPDAAEQAARPWPTPAGHFSARGACPQVGRPPPGPQGRTPPGEPRPSPIP